MAREAAKEAYTCAVYADLGLEYKNTADVWYTCTPMLSAGSKFSFSVSIEPDNSTIIYPGYPCSRWRRDSRTKLVISAPTVDQQYFL